MICPRCGKEIQLSDDSRFCPGCGLEFQRQPQFQSNEKICPRCNTKVQADAMFCPKCGNGFSKNINSINNNNNASRQSGVYNTSTVVPQKPQKEKKSPIVTIGGTFIIICVLIALFAPKPRTMPDVVGKERYEADNAIRDAIGFSTTITEVVEYSDDIANSCIISSEPAAGSSVKKNGTVILHISKGKHMIMPDLSNMTAEQAREQIKEFDMDLYVEGYEYSDSVGKDKIIRFDPPANTDLNEDPYYTVNAVVSKGTRAEELKYYEDNAVEVSYDDLRRYPDTYKDKPIKLSLTIKSVEPDGWIFEGDIMATISGKELAVYDKRIIREPRLMEGDKITVYAIGNGLATLKTYEEGSGILGSNLLAKTVDEEEIPCINIVMTDKDNIEAYETDSTDSSDGSDSSYNSSSEEDDYYEKGREVGEKLKEKLDAMNGDSD